MTYVYRRTEDIDREPTAPYVLREPEVPQMFKKVFKPELCGTTSGYKQHRRLKQQHCPECQEAYNEYQRGYRAGKRCQKPEITTTPSKIGSEKPTERGVRNGTH